MGAFWGQNQHSPHILTTDYQHITHKFLVPPFPHHYPTKYPHIAHDYTYSPSKHVECGQNVGWILSGYNVDGMLEVSMVGGTDY